MDESVSARRPRIVLLGSWQTVNIGDVAHTPGCLTAFKTFAPDAEITLLPRELDDREQQMLAELFPEVRVLTPLVWTGDTALPEEIRTAFEEADLLVHGSGPSVVVPELVRAWRELSDKPYGFFGITVDPFPAQPATLAEGRIMINSEVGDLVGTDRDLLDGAAFVYCRDSLTRDLLRNQGITSAVIEFGPDASPSFAPQRRASEDVLATVSDAGPLLCIVPRLRYTPYHEFRDVEVELFHRRRDAYNAAHAEADLAPLKAAADWWLANTDGTVMVVPEMIYQVEFAQQHFTGGDRLHVLDRFWSLPEASAVYRQATAVVSSECHSPLIAMAVGTPAMYLRQPTDTVKGHMYRDLGVDDWLFEVVDPATTVGVQTQLAAIAADPAGARRTSEQARERALARLGVMVATALSQVPG
ncbi:polysaccharide pyruvyl transferase family protein [Propionibacteriaceae bacterium Y2011]